MPARERPNHLRPAAIGLVVVGGALGAAGREAVVLAVPDVDGLPVAILLVNVVGAFVLGLLYESLTRRSPGEPRAGRLRLLLGTGFCGGFTTYSTLATGTALLLDAARTDVAMIYVAATLVVGTVATVLGIVAGSRLPASDRPVDGGVRR
ncbi:fluoride efflux transporter FluC [Oerskovia rustica]|uniref:Fluoride-specific ion channel FluC n=1 Tax=Oerskovia rustica TaxID=2762237 RepID=A0ABR8RWP5_9CELL|nr:CrcB family protein [Oerskovia rustica]MBD7952199.1 CrcB family protein [Oerskovia rustica]